MLLDTYGPRLYDLSVNVKKRIDGMEYLVNYTEDEITDKTLTIDLFGEYINDLNDIGISFSCDVSEVYESFYMLNMLLDLGEYILPDKIYNLQKTDKDFRDFLVAMKSGTVSNESSIYQIMDYMKNKKSEYKTLFYYYHDKLVSDETFENYLDTVLAFDSEISNTADVEVGSIENYLRYVEYIDIRLEEYLILIDEIDNRILSDGMKATIFRTAVSYIDSLTDQDSVAERAWLHAQIRIKETPTPQERLLADKYRQMFLTEYPFYKAYFNNITNETLKTEDLICLMIRIAIFSKDAKHFFDLWDRALLDIQKRSLTITRDMIYILVQIRIIFGRSFNESD